MIRQNFDMGVWFDTEMVLFCIERGQNFVFLFTKFSEVITELVFDFWQISGCIV